MSEGCDFIKTENLEKWKQQIENKKRKQSTSSCSDSSFDSNSSREERNNDRTVNNKVKREFGDS